MTEDLTADILAYLLEEMDRPRRASFEARLAADPALAAWVKSAADSLAFDALAHAAAPPLSAAERSRSAFLLFTALGHSPRPRARLWARYVWPLAAAALLALNIGQWIAHSRPPALTVDLVGGAEAAPLKNPGVVPTGLRPASPPTAAPLPAGTTTVSITQTLTISHPYAWSAFDRVTHQGVLDLHNLPAVAADQVLQLWVLPTGKRRFEAVGEIPRQFYGRSGSIAYKLGSAAIIPAQIMITVEGRGSRVTSPSGVVVLHGP